MLVTPARSTAWVARQRSEERNMALGLMQAVLSGQMSDQKIKIDIAALKGFVEATDDRTLRLGEKIEQLKDYVQTDISSRLSKIEGRTEVLMWIVGIALSVYMALFIGGGVQVYLLNGRVSGIESDVRHIGGTVDAIRLKQISTAPMAQGIAAEAKNILSAARAKKIPIDKDVIIDTGKTFVSASRDNPEAWDAAISFVDYRSFLNIDAEPRLPSLGKDPPWYEVDILTVNHHATKPIVKGYGVVPAEQGAILARIGQNLYEGQRFGAAFLVLTGDDVILDGMAMKNVIYRGVHIEYHGGPLVMENVYFINCTFTLEPKPTPNSQLLAGKILDSPSLSFTIS